MTLFGLLTKGLRWQDPTWTNPGCTIFLVLDPKISPVNLSIYHDSSVALKKWCVLVAKFSIFLNSSNAWKMIGTTQIWMDSDLRIRKSPKVSVSQEIPKNPKKSQMFAKFAKTPPTMVFWVSGVPGVCQLGVHSARHEPGPWLHANVSCKATARRGGWFWGDLFNGHFRHPNWRYLPYIRPILQAYVREYTHKIWTMVQYLHFRILKWPLIYLSIHPSIYL